ncbi:MAG: hypothetical protein ACM3JI_05795 [Anaerolineae bacterium]
MSIQGFSFIPKETTGNLPSFPTSPHLLIGEVSCRSKIYLTYAVLKEPGAFPSPEQKDRAKACKKIQKCLDNLPGFCKGPECWGEAGFRFRRIRIPNTFETANFSKCGKDVFEQCKKLIDPLSSRKKQAAIKIQSHWRSFSVRATLKKANGTPSPFLFNRAKTLALGDVSTAIGRSTVCLPKGLSAVLKTHQMIDVLNKQKRGTIYVKRMGINIILFHVRAGIIKIALLKKN